MTQDFLPVPTALPPIPPDDVKPIDGKPFDAKRIRNQDIGIGMFGRDEGATLTELRRACLAFTGREMQSDTDSQTKNKLKDNWRWRDIECPRKVEKTKEERGGEPVYNLKRSIGGMASNQQE